MKKQSDFSRLMSYAGNYRYFTYASWVLSAVSALAVENPRWQTLSAGSLMCRAAASEWAEQMCGISPRKS